MSWQSPDSSCCYLFSAQLWMGLAIWKIISDGWAIHWLGNSWMINPPHLKWSGLESSHYILSCDFSKMLQLNSRVIAYILQELIYFNRPTIGSLTVSDLVCRLHSKPLNWVWSWKRLELCFVAKCRNHVYCAISTWRRLYRLYFFNTCLSALNYWTLIYYS